MRKVSQKGQCIDWLQDRLKDGGVQSNVLYAEAREFGWSPTVMLRAAAELDILSTSVAGDYNRRTVWTLPD